MDQSPLRTDMQFFTSNWMKGYSVDDAFDAYRDHLLAIASRLPGRALEFARSVSIHDGRIQRVSYKAGGDMVMLLRCGDFQVGYHDLELTYHDLCLVRSDLRSLAAICLDPSEELLYDEFDIEDDLVVHRILFSSLVEVRFVFATMEYRMTPTASREFVRGVDSLDGLDAFR